MSRNGGCDFRELIELQKNLEKYDKEMTKFFEDCAKELAARLLAKVVKRTPVGRYGKEVDAVAKRDSKHHKKGDIYKRYTNPSGKVGGTLRKGWTGGEKANAKGYAQSLRVNHYGDTYVIVIKNPVEYASYVEYGHRHRGGKGWTKGKFMLTLSESELQRVTPKIIEKKIEKFLKRCFG